MICWLSFKNYFSCSYKSVVCIAGYIMSSDSMSVHSLIDKFSNSERVSNEQRGVGTRKRGSEVHQKSQQQQTQQDEVNQEHVKEANTNSIDETGLLSLLGPNVKSFPLSEEAYIESIKLRTEQEKTKQSYYKLETANKNLLMLNTALKANIPPNLIPLMYVPNEDVNAKPNIDPGFKSGVKLESSSAVFSPFQQGNRAGVRNLYQQDTSSSSLVPPINYKFGGSNTPNATRRPLSPAKIGAAAVANLATPTNPYKNNRRNILPLHQRHFSMPAPTSSVTPNRNRATPGDLNAIDTTLQPQNKLKPPSNISTLNASGNTSDSGTLQSPLGATSSIQVKPSPAQPLHKLTRLANPPSQESMTSFQHIIQFHHWKPDGPSVGSSTGGSPMRMHKRHKSSSENMSIDLTPNSFSNINENAPVIRVNNSHDIDINSNDDQDVDDDEDDDDNDNDVDDDDDITMETSTITDINVSKIPRTESFDDSNNDTLLNIGRYPHDILSPSNS